MFNPYSQQNNIDKINYQIQELEKLKSGYQNMPQQPINNIISTGQPQIPQNNNVEWRVLNENEEVDNLYVSNKTLFINDNMMVLKGVDGSLEKWEIKKIYPIDKKDEKINELENKIKEMEAKLNEYAKPDKSINDIKQSNVNDDEYVKPKSKTSSK